MELRRHSFYRPPSTSWKGFSHDVETDDDAQIDHELVIDIPIGYIVLMIRAPLLRSRAPQKLLLEHLHPFTPALKK